MKTGVTILASGSNGNCIAVQYQGNTILLDCGLSLKMLRARMAQECVDPDSVRAILVTHKHGDHMKGVGAAAGFLGVPVFSPYEVAELLQNDKKHPVTATVLDTGASFDLSGFQITPFPVEHDVETVGFVLTTPEAKIGIATDIGRPTQTAAFHLRDCQTLVLESNYDVNMLAASPRDWGLKTRICGGKGHLSNKQNSEFLPRLLTRNTRNLILAHISHDCNKYELALGAARKTLHELNREDVFLDYGRREEPLPTVWC